MAEFVDFADDLDAMLASLDVGDVGGTPSGMDTMDALDGLMGDLGIGSDPSPAASAPAAAAAPVAAAPAAQPQMGSGMMPSTGPGRMPSTGPGRMPSTGPGMMVSTGPGRMPSTGPGMMGSTGPGRMPSTGPGMMGRGMPSTGPGRMPSTGPGMMGRGMPSTGPGRMPSTGPGRMVSTGPGRMPSTGPGMVPGQGQYATPGPPGMVPGQGQFATPGPPGMVPGQGQYATPGPPGGLPPAGRGGGGVGGTASSLADGRKVQATGPPCAHCGEMVIGRVLNAIGKQWHPDHFVCDACSQPFKDGRYVEREGKPYCEDDYYELFGSRCIRCELPIKGNMVNALGQTFHPEHFTCSGCGTPLAGKAYKEAGGDPYCAACKKNMLVELAPQVHMCGKCKQPIIGEYVMLRGMYMHPEHFRCAMCGCEFVGGDCNEHDGKLYCREDYLRLQKDECAGCQQPIIGRSLTAMGKAWHPEHFVCARCHEPFAGGKFYEKDGKPFCEAHYQELYGEPCFKCNKPVAKSGVDLGGHMYHLACFTCQTCDIVLDSKVKNYQFQGKPMCRRCYMRLPSKVRKAAEKADATEQLEEKKRNKLQEKEEKRIEKEFQKRAKEKEKARGRA